MSSGNISDWDVKLQLFVCLQQHTLACRTHTHARRTHVMLLSSFGKKCIPSYLPLWSSTTDNRLDELVFLFWSINASVIFLSIKISKNNTILNFGLFPQIRFLFCKTFLNVSMADNSTLDLFRLDKEAVQETYLDLLIWFVCLCMPQEL